MVVLPLFVLSSGCIVAVLWLSLVVVSWFSCLVFSCLVLSCLMSSIGRKISRKQSDKMYTVCIRLAFPCPFSFRCCGLFMLSGLSTMCHCLVYLCYLSVCRISVSVAMSFFFLSSSILHISVYQSMWLCPWSSILGVIFCDLYLHKPSVFCLVSVLSYPVFVVFDVLPLSCLRFCLQVQIACASQDYAYTEVSKHTRFLFCPHNTRQDTDKKGHRQGRRRERIDTDRQTQTDRDKKKISFETVIGQRQDKDEDKAKGKY